MCKFGNGEFYIDHMDKAQSNATSSAFSWSDGGKKHFT